MYVCITYPIGDGPAKEFHEVSFLGLFVWYRFKNDDLFATQYPAGMVYRSTYVINIISHVFSIYVTCDGVLCGFYLHIQCMF